MNFIRKTLLTFMAIGSITSGLYSAEINAVLEDRAIQEALAIVLPEQPKQPVDGLSPLRMIGSGAATVWSGMKAFDGYYRSTMRYLPLAVIADRILLNSAAMHHYYHVAYDVPFEEMNVAPCSNFTKLGFIASCAALYKIVGLKNLDNGWHTWLAYAPWILLADKLFLNRVGQKLYHRFMYAQPKATVTEVNDDFVEPKEIIQPKMPKLAKSVTFVPGDVAPEVEPIASAVPKETVQAKRSMFKRDTTNSSVATDRTIPFSKSSEFQAFQNQVQELMPNQNEQNTLTVDYQMQTDAPSYIQQMRTQQVAKKPYSGRGYAGRRRRYQHRREVKPNRYVRA